MGTEWYRGEMPCMCGQGLLKGERSEHDVYLSRHQTPSWTFTCPACEARYKVVHDSGKSIVVDKLEYEEYKRLASPGWEVLQSVKDIPAFNKKTAEAARAYLSKIKVCDAPPLHFSG